MSAPPRSDPVLADRSSVACVQLAILGADGAGRSVQQVPLFVHPVHGANPVMRSAAADDTPTDQLLASSQQRAVTREMRGELARGCVLRARYVLEDVIGRGGISVVLRAKDLHRPLPPDSGVNSVAIKMLRPEQRSDPLALVRLKREFEQMQRLLYPGVAKVFDLDCDGDVWFMSMELIEGQTVKSWVESHSCSQASALQIIVACCKALEHAHSLGILHGDLKPTNVMVTDEGTAKLIDFGSAPSVGDRAIAGPDLTLAATPLYASPQILGGKCAERRDDVYSLACLSYYLLSGGRHPYGGRPSLEDGRSKSAPNPVRGLAPGLFEVIERGLSADRERRPASVGEFLGDLTDVDRHGRAESMSVARSLRGSVGTMHDSGSTRPTAKQPLRSKWPILAERIGLKALGGTSAHSILGLMALVFAIAGIAVLFRMAAYRDLIRAPELPLETSVRSPVLMSTAPTLSAVTSSTRSPVQDSGVISFEAASVHANTEQTLVAISVRRLQSTKNPGAFVWRVERGTAHPGVDYERIEPQVVRFIEGQAVRTLYIPLINSPGTVLPRGTRTFGVALRQVAGGPSLGRFTRITVAIDPPPISSIISVYQARVTE